MVIIFALKDWLVSLGINLKPIKNRTVNREGLEEQFELAKEFLKPSSESKQKEWSNYKSEYIESDVASFLHNDSNKIKKIKMITVLLIQKTHINNK